MKQLLWVALTVGAVGCTNSASAVTQAGTTPAPRPHAYDGQPLDKPMRVEGRFAQVVTPIEETGNTYAGNYISRTYSGFGIRGGHDNTDVGLETELAWTSGAEPIAPDLAPPPSSDYALSMVMSGRHSLPINEQFRLGIAFGMGFVSAPVRANGVDKGHDEAGFLDFGVVPSWRQGPFVVFGGMNFTSEVAVPKIVIADDDFDTPEARASGSALVLSAGATMIFDSGLRITGQFAQPVGSEYARHGLQVDLVFGFEFGEKPAPRPAGPPPPPPGYYYPPPPGAPGAPPPAPAPAPTPPPPPPAG
jgi:hypothetical protein